jgi:hypothetical protein
MLLELMFFNFRHTYKRKTKEAWILTGDFIRNMLANATPHGHHRAHTDLCAPIFASSYNITFFHFVHLPMIETAVVNLPGDFK